MDSETEQILTALDAWTAEQLHPDAVMEAWPDAEPTPAGVAWMKAVAMRPFPCRPAALSGYRRAAQDGVWQHAVRDPEEIVRRICHMTLCARAVAALADEDLDRHTQSVQHPAFLDGGPAWFEHPEGRLLLAVAQGGPLERAVVAQLSWRDHAASTLAWAVGWHDDNPLEGFDLERLFGLLPDTLEALQERVDSLQPRPLHELRDMLAWAQKGLDPTGGPSLRHSMSVERVKALRWLTEPWWPELALTPWRDQGTGFESIMSPEAFDEKRRAALDDLSRA